MLEVRVRGKGKRVGKKMLKGDKGKRKQRDRIVRVGSGEERGVGKDGSGGRGKA